MVTGARAPFVVACADDIRPNRNLKWIDCPLVPAETYRLRALIEGTPNTADIAAMVRFDTADPTVGGKGLRLTESAGEHCYLRTGPGLHRTDRLFSIGTPSTRFGLMAWGDRGETVIRTLTIERVDIGAQACDFFFSFDVEASPARAQADLIDRLIWGRLGGGEYGIGRICDVLEQHRIVGNFLLDYATCAFEGERRMREIVDLLAGRGHEIHLHLHPDQLGPYWGLEVAPGKSMKLDGTSYDMTRRLLDFAVARHEQYVGQVPRLFRSGSYRTSPALVLAAGALGIEALSNITKDMVGDPSIGGDLVREREPFVWDNGVIEIPVDYSSPEAGTFDAYIEKYVTAMRRKNTERTFNLVMHSWSLTRRNAEGHQEAFDPAYEERLHEMCDHATRNGRVYGYGEWLDERRLPRPAVKLDHIRAAAAQPVYVASADIATCNVCDAVFSRERIDGGRCPGCDLGAPHRQLKHVIETFGNVFDGRTVLAYKPGPAERRRILAGAACVVEASELEIEHLRAVEDGSFDAFVGLRFLGEQTSPDVAAAEIARTLTPGGVFVSIEPALEATTEPDDHASAMVDRYYRGLLLTDYADVLAKEFTVTAIPGFDSVTKTSGRVFLAYRR
jgi:hypothetical protein